MIVYVQIKRFAPARGDRRGLGSRREKKRRLLLPPAYGVEVISGGCWAEARAPDTPANAALAGAPDNRGYPGDKAGIAACRAGDAITRRGVIILP